MENTGTEKEEIIPTRAVVWNGFCKNLPPQSMVPTLLFISRFCCPLLSAQSTIPNSTGDSEGRQRFLEDAIF
jgi:hypothetical protein